MKPINRARLEISLSQVEQDTLKTEKYPLTRQKHGEESQIMPISGLLKSVETIKALCAEIRRLQYIAVRTQRAATNFHKVICKIQDEVEI